MSLQNLHVPFNINVAFTDVSATHDGAGFYLLYTQCLNFFWNDLLSNIFLQNCDRNCIHSNGLFFIATVCCREITALRIMQLTNQNRVFNKKHVLNINEYQLIYWYQNFFLPSNIKIVIVPKNPVSVSIDVDFKNISCRFFLFDAQSMQIFWQHGPSAPNTI